MNSEASPERPATTPSTNGNGDSRPTDVELTKLVERIRRLDRRGARAIIGITGTPGAGKSTLADQLAARLPESKVVPLDGFHIANNLLNDSGIHARKGAIETFDLAGYRHLLERLSADQEDTIYAPSYYRELEESIAASIVITRATRTIITEGNYLLADNPDIVRARPLFDEIWYIDTPDELRLPRLMQRHVRFGKSHAAASEWALGVDQDNADLIRTTKPRADLIVSLPWPSRDGP